MMSGCRGCSSRADRRHPRKTTERERPSGVPEPTGATVGSDSYLALALYQHITHFFLHSPMAPVRSAVVEHTFDAHRARPVELAHLTRFQVASLASSSRPLWRGTPYRHSRLHKAAISKTASCHHQCATTVSRHVPRADSASPWTSPVLPTSHPLVGGCSSP